jgi:V-type H+-transporting ATPase subunit a
MPPTSFYENEFFNPSQLLTNEYGIPNYKELNPTVINSVTFPFLFGVMFGDIGHGSVLLLFGIFLCLGKDMLMRN